MKFLTLCLLLTLMTIDPQAQAKTIQLQCQEGFGYSYYADLGYKNESTAGWKTAKPSNDEFIIRINLDSKQVEYRYKGASGIWYDAKDEDANMLLWHEQDDPITLSVQINLKVDKYASLSVFTFTNFDFEKKTSQYQHTKNIVYPDAIISRVESSSCKYSVVE